MKLQNKKTGEIIDLSEGTIRETCFGTKIQLQAVAIHDKPIWIYNSLAELNEVWEDYHEPKEDGLDHIIILVEDYSNHNSERYPKEIVEKLKAWKRLKEAGFRFNGGDDACISYRFDPVKWDDRLDNDFDLLFGGEE